MNQGRAGQATHALKKEAIMADKLNAPISFEEIAQRSATRFAAQERKRQMLRTMLLLHDKVLDRTREILGLDSLEQMQGLPSWYILAVALSGQPLKIRVEYKAAVSAGFSHPLTVPDPKDCLRAAKFVPTSKHGGPGVFRFGEVIVRPNSVIPEGALAGEIDFNGVIGVKLYDKQGRVAYCEGVGVVPQLSEGWSELTKPYEELTLQEIGQFRGWRYKKLSPKESIDKLYAIRRFVGGYRLAQEEVVAEEIPVESTPVLEQMEIPDEELQVEVQETDVIDTGDDDLQTDTAHVEA